MSEIIKYIVNDKYNGKTVEQLSRGELHISAKLFKRLKLNGRLKINGVVCRSIDILKKDDVFTADISEFEKSDIEPNFIPLDILYEDNEILVVNKPPFMSVHPSMGNYKTTLANAVMYHFMQSGDLRVFRAVNRLDKNTSGICVIAKTQYVHSLLSKQIQSGEFKRRYLAVVHGKTADKSGVIDLPIKRECESIIKRIVSEDGKRAVTHFNVLKENEKFSVLDIVLMTGRTHQIRVHFSHIGNPLFGDFLYGTENDDELINRQALHAYTIKFLHPVTLKELSFTAKLPDDMVRLLKKLSLME